MRVKDDTDEISVIQMICQSLEMRPLVKCRKKDIIDVESKLNGLVLLEDEPSYYDYEYQDFLDSIKTTIVIEDWINEMDESYLLENYDIRPGELRVKIDNCDWLLYAASELATACEMAVAGRLLRKARMRVRYGVKEELLGLLRLKGIGRVRARMLFRNGLTDMGLIKKAGYYKLEGILGKKLATDVCNQLEIKRPKGLDEF